MIAPVSPAAAISIVVVTYNCAAQLRQLIESLNRHLDGEQELIVVDNASADDPTAEARRWKGPCELIALDQNLGFGVASNIGVERARAPVTVLLNPDTELLDASLVELAASSARLGGLVGPRLLNADRTMQPSASGPEVGIWPWVRALVPSPLQSRRMLARTEPYRLETLTPVSWLTGACIAAPTQALRRLGPFDAQLHMYGEDVDLGLRAAADGIGSWIDPVSCRIIHHGQGSSTLVYGSAEGWWPTGTLHWRAVVQRAFGRRREWLAWRALRLNLRLRLIGKALTGRTDPRNRAALDAAVAAQRPPRLLPVNGTNEGPRPG